MLSCRDARNARSGCSRWRMLWIILPMTFYRQSSRDYPQKGRRIIHGDSWEVAEGAPMLYYEVRFGNDKGLRLTPHRFQIVYK